MGYSWISAGVGNPTQDEIMNEIQDNIDLLYDDLELNRRSWGSSIREGTEVDDSHMESIKTAVDYAYEMNYCRTHHADHNLTDLDVYYASDDTTHNYNDKSYHDSNHDSGEYSAANNYNYMDRETSHLTNFNTSDESTYNNAEYEVVDNGFHTTRRDHENSSVDLSHNESKLFNHNTSADNSEYRTNRSSHNSKRDSAFRTSVQASDYTSEFDYSMFHRGCLSYHTLVCPSYNEYDLSNHDSSDNDPVYLSLRPS